MLEKWKNESGVIIIEASIYFPIVIFTVFSMIYFGMVKYQESILAFQVQKLAILGGKEVAYPGYEAFGIGNDIASSSVDFLGGTDFSGSIQAYYEGNAANLYNEWKMDYTDEENDLKSTLESMLDQHSFLTGITSTADVKIKSSILGKEIFVEADYGLKSPKMLSIVGVPLDITLKTAVKQSASNPVDLVRNIDLAIDLATLLMEKFGIKDDVDAFLKKAEDIKNGIL